VAAPPFSAKRLEWEDRLARVVELTTELDLQTNITDRKAAALAQALSEHTCELKYKEELWAQLFHASQQLRFLSNIEN